MKILMLGHYEIASNYALSLVVNALFKEHEIKVMLSGRGDAFEKSSSNLEANTFAALAQYEQELCDELNAGINSLRLDCDSFDVLANKTKHAIEILAKPNSRKGLAEVNSFAPDLIVSIRFRKYLKEPLIAIPKFGVINLHSGRLPEYRGAMATFWSMLNGEKEIGSVVHYISDSGVDTGNIISKSTINCDYSITYLQNVLALYPQGSKNIVDAVQKIALGNSLESSQQLDTGTYYSFPSDEHRISFLTSKHLLFTK